MLIHYYLWRFLSTIYYVDKKYVSILWLKTASLRAVTSKLLLKHINVNLMQWSYLDDINEVWMK